MEIFTAASHHDVLVVIIQFSVLLLSARVLGEIAQRFGQPSVVGEIFAGILLGPSILGGLIPVIGEWIIPQTEVQGYLLELISLIGAMFLLLITGLETDIALIKRHSKTAISVSLGGIAFTFSSGFLLGLNLPDELLVDPDKRLIFSMFVATAMSISAIPVIAKVLMDLNLIRRDVGQTIIAAGMSDDTIGWILLSIVTGLASGSAVDAGTILGSIGNVAAFMILSFTLGRWIVKKVFIYVQDEIQSRDRLLSLVIIFAFLWGAISQALNLEAVLGAFVMGIIFGQMPRLPDQIHHQLESIALGIFAPVFFATAGLKVNIQKLASPEVALTAVIVIIIATSGKVAGTYIGARFIGKKDHWTSLSFGAGLNARGAMEIIIATIGLSIGILTQDMFSIIVLMAIVTSLMAPFALRYTLSKVKPEKQELERLKKEELASQSFIANIHRVLVPVRTRSSIDGVTQSIEAKILESISEGNSVSITLMTSIPESSLHNSASAYLDELTTLFKGIEIQKKIVVSSNATDAILDEAKKDYDFMILGAPESSDIKSDEVLFNPVVDYLVRVAPCPTMVVKGKNMPDTWKPCKILVPTNGTKAAKNAAEVAFAISKTNQLLHHVGVLNVVVRGHLDHVREHVRASGNAKQMRIGYQIVRDIKSLGETLGVNTEAMVQVGTTPEEVILNVSDMNGYDLIVLGTDIRPGSDRLFLGPRVERILSKANCPVIIVNG